MDHAQNDLNNLLKNPEIQLLLWNMRSKRAIGVMAVIVFGVLGVVFFIPVSQVAPISQIFSDAHTVLPPTIEAQAALAQNLVTGEILFEKNKTMILPLASLTKIVSVLAVLNSLSWSQEVLISKEALATPEPSSLKVGEYLTVKNLVIMAMVESSNDAISALVEQLGDAEWFLQLMHDRAVSFGATSMKFYNPTGLDISSHVAGAFGSPQDVLLIARHSLDAPIWQWGSIREIVSQEGFLHRLRPTNTIEVDVTPLIGVKTGFTDLAGGNLLIITEYPVGQPVGIVVLASTLDGRFSDVKKILKWIRSDKNE